MKTNKHNSNADLMTAWQTPAGQLPLDVAARHASMTVHSVLAGAYRGKRTRLDAMCTHASTDGGSTAVCGNVAEGNLCDVQEPGPPTCKKCARLFQ